MMKTKNRISRIGNNFVPALKAKSRTRRETFELARQHEPMHSVRRNDIAPSLELVERALVDLVAPPRNVRKITQTHVQEVANSIATLGFCVPVLVDQNNRVLDGTVRVEAAKRLGLPTIPCVVAAHLTASERKLLRVALNRLQERGTWDLPALKLEFEELILTDAPIEIAGFSSTELDQILLGNDLAIEEGPLAPEPNQQAVARRGDVFLLGEHIIACGDATDPADVARVFSSQEARLLLTDVPYNVKIAGNVTKRAHREFVMASGEMNATEFLKFNSNWISACSRCLVDGGVLATFIDWRGYPTIHAAALQESLTPINLVVWSKTNAGMGSLYRSQHELLPLFKKGRAPHVNNVLLGKSGRWRSNVWQYPGASSVGSDARKGIKHHPTVKPVALLEDALLDLTQRGDIVFDPFLGSGSMLVAAERSGRRCFGTELDPLYVDVAIRRFERTTGSHAILQATGASFSNLAEQRRDQGDDT